MNTEATCLECGHELTGRPEGSRCPACGLKVRTIEASDRVTIRLMESARLKAKQAGIRGYVRDEQIREKVSRRGIPARERLLIDRSDPRKTVKVHRVEENAGKGWEVVHDHTEEYPSKRRKQKEASDA